MVMFTFSIFNQKYLFLDKFDLKNQNCQFEIQYLYLFRYAVFYGGVHILCFQLETLFLGKFDSKNQNYQFKLKCGTGANSNIQNLLVMFTFPAFDRKYFFGQIYLKIYNCQFKMKFGAQTDLNMQNSMVVFIFSDMAGNTLLGQIWPRKSKLLV